MTTPRHRAWALGASDAESVLAEARKALFVMVAFLAILWIIQVANAFDHYQLTNNYGIRPRELASLPDIVTAPFLHVSWTHIESNSGPLFIFGFLAAYRGVVRFLGLTAMVIVVSGLAAWFFGDPHSNGVGASGVVFGYLGYILVRGFFDRHGIGWQAHIGGLVAGVVGGWLFRDRSARAARKQAATAGAATTAVAPGAAVTGPARGQPAPAKQAPAKPAADPQAGATGELYQGPRGNLHRQLDDLGY